jgi:hypothetical protein
MSSNAQSNEVFFKLTSEEKKEVDNIYSQAVKNLLEEFPEINTFSNEETQTSEEDLDALDRELESAIKLLNASVTSRSSTSANFTQSVNINDDKYNDIESFLEKYEKS